MTPFQTDNEVILYQTGRASVVLRNGIQQLWLGNIVHMTKSESEINNYKLIVDLFYGKVLEVGLGFGMLNNLLHENNQVDTIVSFEIVQDFIDVYNHLYSHSNQQIVAGDAFDCVDDISNDFNAVAIDTYYKQDEDYYNRLKTFLHKIYSHLLPNGIVVLPCLRDELTQDILESITNCGYTGTTVSHVFPKGQKHDEWIKLIKQV